MASMRARVRDSKQLNGSARFQILAAERMIELGYHDRFIEKIGICLDSTKRFWSDAKGDWIVEPDFPSILKACQLGMPYVFGLPPQRQEIVQVMAIMDGNGEVSEAGKDSVAALASILAGKIGKAPGVVPAKAEPSNIDAGSGLASLPVVDLAADEVE